MTDNPNVGNTIRHSVPSGYYTRSQTAAKIGRSIATLRSWQMQGVFVPTWYVQMGQLKVTLYDKDDIKVLKQLAKTRKPGRPKKSVSSE